MSVERAREFLQAAAADPAFQARLDSAASREEGLEAIRAAGYSDVTAEDLSAVLRACAGGEKELTDAELEGVAGGSAMGKFVVFVATYGSKLAGWLGVP